MRLEELINHQIFESYHLVTDTSLQKEVTSVAVLETPDFKNYIFDHSLILTTFYIIKKDIKKFEELMHVMSEYKTAGLIIKLHRYVDEIPKKIISYANKNDIPILLLDYDANLSSIFQAVYSELQSQDYLEQNFHVNFTKCMESIQKNPSTRSLIEAIKDLKDFEVLFYNYESGHIKTSSDELIDIYENLDFQGKNYYEVDQHLLYREDIYCNNLKAYCMLIRTTNNNRHILYTYNEIFKILITQIHQRRKDIAMELDQFLINFISNFTSTTSTNQDIIDEGKIYNWDIQFPLVLLLVTNKNSTNTITGVQINLMRESFQDMFKIKSNEMKYTIFQNKIVFFMNAKLASFEYANKIHQLLEDTDEPFYEQLCFSITKPIADAALLPNQYRQLIDATTYVLNNNSNISIIPPDFVNFYKIVRSLDSETINSVIHDSLDPILIFEKDHHIPLAKTLLTYIQSHFNAVKTAKILYIHYNTLKYRLGVLQDLGYDLTNTNEEFLPLYMALYLNDITKKIRYD